MKNGSGDDGCIDFLGSVISIISKVKDKKTYIRNVTEEIIATTMADKNYDSPVVLAIEKRLMILENNYQFLQEAVMEQAEYDRGVGNLANWLVNMESKVSRNMTEIQAITDVGEVGIDMRKGSLDKSVRFDEQISKGKEDVKLDESTRKDSIARSMTEEVDVRGSVECIMAEEVEVTETTSQVTLLAPELQATNERLKKLGLHLSEQLHSLRDKVFVVDHELKRMAKGVEFALLRTKMSGGTDMVSFSFSSSFCSFYFFFLFPKICFLSFIVLRFHYLLPSKHVDQYNKGDLR